MPDAIQQDEEDVVRYSDSTAPVSAPPSYISTAQAAPAASAPVTLPGSSDAVIGAAAGQLNAGQPVTALPHQSWSLPEAQAFAARLDAFDQQAKAARSARDAAARDAQMLDQMMRVARSTKDIEVAMQTQDQIGFRSAVASGTPALQALQRFPRAATSPLVAALRDSQPHTLTKFELPGVPPGVVDSAGRPHWPPASLATHPDMPTVAQPITTPEGKVLGYGAQTGPGTRRIVSEAKPGTLDASTRKEIDLLSREKAALDKEMASGAWQAKATLPEYKAEQDAAKARLDFIAKRLGELLPGAFPRGTPAPTRSATRNPKTGKWELK